VSAQLREAPQTRSKTVTKHINPDGSVVDVTIGDNVVIGDNVTLADAR
jgi:acetyltransferase-like isoleucine patch superfamily enzyme